MLKVGQVVYNKTPLEIEAGGVCIPVGSQGVVVAYEKNPSHVPASAWFPYEVHFKGFTRASEPFLCREDELTA